MLDPLWLLPLLGSGIWAFWAGHDLLALAVSLGLLISASLIFWQRYCLAGVTYQRHLSTNRAKFGETVALTASITNLKPLPLTWLKIEDIVPPELPIDGGVVKDFGAIAWHYLILVCAMLPYECIVRHMRVRCLHRGEFNFGPASLESGDYLGALSSYRSSREQDQLVVFPKLFSLDIGRVASNQIVGREAIRRQFLTDPLRIAGARNYVPGDPFRIIDWRASARTGGLIVRLFEPTTTPLIDLVVDFTSRGAKARSYERDEIEHALSVAASFTAYAIERRWTIGLRGNGRSGGLQIDVPPSAAPQQLATILEVLARASTIPTDPIAARLDSAVTRAWGGASLVLVTTALTNRTLQSLVEKRRRGVPVTVIHVVRRDVSSPDARLPILRVDHDEHWIDRDTLVLGE
jgi:uncharacterized protein (DUF58 family)